MCIYVYIYIWKQLNFHSTTARIKQQRLRPSLRPPSPRTRFTRCVCLSVCLPVCLSVCLSAVRRLTCAITHARARARAHTHTHTHTQIFISHARTHAHIPAPPPGRHSKASRARKRMQLKTEKNLYNEFVRHICARASRSLRASTVMLGLLLLLRLLKMSEQVSGGGTTLGVWTFSERKRRIFCVFIAPYRVTV
jgi:hypothetical protein